MPRKKEAVTVTDAAGASASAVAVTRSARTRQLTSKVELNKTPLENKLQQLEQKTPVPKTVKSKAAFPDRLNWKMTHLRMPTTSTPKVDLTSRKITKTDVDTAFGFDDSCVTEKDANYSTVISPIAHSSPKTGALGVWKVNPLSQRNVEVELPKSLSQPDRNIADEGKIARSKTKVGRKTKPVAKNTSAETIPVKSTQSKSTAQPKEFEGEVTIQLSPTLTESSKKESVQAISSRVVSEEPTKSDLQQRQAPESEPVPVAPKSRSKTVKGKPKESTIEPERRRTRARSKISTTDTPKPAFVTEEAELPTTTPEASRIISTKSDVAVTDPTVKTKSSKTRSRKAVPASDFEKTKTKPISAAVTAKRRMPSLFEDASEEPSGISPFSQLLEKHYNDEPEKEELRVDPRKIIRTYSSSRKRVKYSEDRETEYDFVPTLESYLELVEPEKQPRSKRKPNAKKHGSKSKSKKQEMELDEEAERWAEEQRKEFEEIMKAPLVIEKSFTE